MTGSDSDLPISIRLADDNDRERWDAYVANNAAGDFFHRFGWREVIASAYGYGDVYLIAECGEAIVGVLPLIDVRSPLLGRSLISTAFTIGGGPLFDDGNVRDALYQKAEDIGRERSVRYVELRCNGDMPANWVGVGGRYANFSMQLPQEEDQNLSVIPRRRRAEVRKAVKSKADGVLNVCHGLKPDRFYNLYASALRDHGTPVFPHRFLNALVDKFEADMDMTFIETDDGPIVGLLSFKYKNKYMPYYIGATRDARRFRGAELVFWSAMRRAVELDYATYDFGRSKVDTGPFQFKKLWGIEPEMLTYQYNLIGVNEAPNINPNNPKFRMFADAWRRLPLPLANQLGPLLAPNFA